MAGRKQETQLRTAGGIQYELTRKRVKNLNIRVREDGTVAVSIPLRTSAEAADRFVTARADWVQQARERAMRRAAQEARPLPDKGTALAYFMNLTELKNLLLFMLLGTGVLLLSDYLGLLTCLGLSVIAYLKIWGREKWIKSIVIGVCMVAFLYGVFVLFLHVPVPKGPLGF